MENRKMVSFPECILCKTSFKVTGPTPFLLPCLHAVCVRCMKSAAKELECPCCPKHRDNQETKLKVDKVRKEFVLHMTAKYHPSELLCNHEEDGNQAVTWCIDCQELFCEFCYNLHSGFKALKGHVFKSLGELSEGKAGLSSASEKEKGVMKVFQDLKETCEKKIQQTESNLSALQTSGELQMEHISQTFEMLRSLLDQREKEVKLHFEAKQQESLTFLRRDGKVLRTIITFCRGILEYDQMASTVWVPDDDMKYNDPLKKTQLYSSRISKISGKQSQSIKFETKDLQLLREIICGFAKISNETKINCDKPATQKEIHQTLTWTCRRCRNQNNTDTFTCSTCKGQVKDNAHIAITMAPTGAMATGVMKEDVKAFQFEAAESGCEKKGLVGRGEIKTPPNTNVSSQKPMVQAQIFSPTSGMQPHAGYSTRILGAPSKTGLLSLLQAGAVQAGLSKPMPKDRSIFSTVGCSSLPAQSSFATPSTGVPAQSSFATPSTGTPTQSSFATPSTGVPAQRSIATPSNVPAESCFVIPSTAAPALSNFMTPSTRVPAQSSCSTPSRGVPAQISSMSPSTGVSAQSCFATPSTGAPTQSSFATPSTGVPAQSSFATPSTGTPTQSSFATPSTGVPAQRSFATPSNVPAESCFVIPSTAAPALSNFMTPSTRVPAQSSCSTPSRGVPAQISSMSPSTGVSAQSCFATPSTGAPTQSSFETPSTGAPAQRSFATPSNVPAESCFVIPSTAAPALSNFMTPSIRVPAQRSCSTPSTGVPEKISSMSPSTGVPAQSCFATPSTGPPTQSSFATPSTGAPAQRNFATPSNVPAESCFVIPSTAAPALSNFMTPSTRVPAQSSCSTPSTGVRAQISSMSPSTGVSAQSSSMTPSSATTGFLKNVSSPSTQKFFSTPSAVLVQSSLLTPKKVANGENGHSKTKHSVPQRDSTFRQQSEQAGFLFDRNVSSTSKFDFATKPAEETAGFKFTNPFTELKEEKGLTFNFGHADNDTVSKTDGAGCVPSVQN